MIRAEDRDNHTPGKFLPRAVALAVVLLAIVLIALSCTDRVLHSPTAPVVEAKTVPSQTVSPTMATEPAFVQPFFISLFQYNSGSYTEELLALRPLVVRAVVAGSHIEKYDVVVQSLAAIDEPNVSKMLGFSSLADLEEKLALPGPPGFDTQADYLLSIGIVGFTYNTEISPEGIPWTPPDEMANLFNTDPQQNSVARFAQIATSYGFSEVVWVPYRYMADGYESPGQRHPQYEEVLQLMYDAGMTGVGLQEQTEIGSACAEERANAFQETLTLHRAASDQTDPFMMVHVLLDKCVEGESYAADHCGLTQNNNPWDHCELFVDLISGNLDTLSVPNRPSDELIDFFRQIRFSVSEAATYLPLIVY